MDSYGQILKEAREAKKLDLEKISSDTSITKQYILALEAEEDTVFPGEAYLVGYLRNYSDYLGTNTAELMQLYHAKKLQETPVPKELLESSKPKFLVPLLVVFGLLCIFTGVGIWLYIGVFKIPEKRAAEARIIAENKKSHQYNFDGSTQNVRLYKGDQIFIPSGIENGQVVLTVANTQNSLSVNTPSGSQVVELSEERAIDVTGDGIPDIIFYVSDIDMVDGSRGAEVRMLLKDKTTSEIIEITDNADEEKSGNEIEVSTSNSGPRTVVHEDTRAYPFTVNISFRGACLFRYKSDNKDVIESYYRNGDVINVSNNNGYRLWASNINAMKIHIIAGLASYDLEIGKAGEVVVEDIKWVRDSDGMYRLIVQQVD